jgi:type III restriction enzyme
MLGSEVYKIVLYNQDRFTDLYNLAREIYAQILATKASNKTATVKEYEQPWDVPDFKIFNDKYISYESDVHALYPLFARVRGSNQLFDSANEHRFIQLLVENEVHILWWYKNGSSSKEDFAVPYTKKDGTQSLFYVDMVVKFKNGILGLFDPKTIESDVENVPKHNALIEFIEARNNQKKPTIGGIVLPHQGSWRFCRNRIENDKDLTGWDFFNPADINKN